MKADTPCPRAAFRRTELDYIILGIARLFIGNVGQSSPPLVISASRGRTRRLGTPTLNNSINGNFAVACKIICEQGGKR